MRGAFQESMEKVKGLKCYMSPGEKKKSCDVSWEGTLKKKNQPVCILGQFFDRGIFSGCFLVYRSGPLGEVVPAAWWLRPSGVAVPPGHKLATDLQQHRCQTAAITEGPGWWGSTQRVQERLRAAAAVQTR